MIPLYLRKLFSLTFTYGWLGLLYGSLFSFIPQEFGYTLHPISNGFVILSTVAFTVAWTFRIEMRMYTPSSKYWIIMLLGLVGVFIGAKVPLLYPFFFLVLLAMMEYPCRDCVVFTRMKL